MTDTVVDALVWLAAFAAVVGVFVSLSRSKNEGSAPGPAAFGAVYDLLNEDKRKAVEIVVEERAEARDPEDADGNLPDLENPRPRVTSDNQG